MPNALVQSVAQKTGKPTSEIERLWKKTGEIIDNPDISDADKYAYLVGILKNILGLKEDFGIGVSAPAALDAGFPSETPENSGVFANKIGKIQKRKIPYVEWLRNIT